MSRCILLQIRPVLFLAKILGLNWFETIHHHNCLSAPTPTLRDATSAHLPVWKHCQFRSTFFSFGSILNLILLLITILSTIWTSVNIPEFISQFFTDIEFFTYTGYIILYYWQTPPLLLIPRFTFRPLPKLWETLLTIFNKLAALQSTTPTYLQKEQSRSRLSLICWVVTIVTLTLGVAYLVFFLIVIYSLCSTIKATSGVDCYGTWLGKVGINMSAINFFLVCICPQIISILFFLHCFVVKGLLDKLGQALYDAVNLSVFISEREKCHRILALRLLYSELVDAVRIIGDAFGLQLLIVIISSILSLIVATYIMFLTSIASSIPGFDSGSVSGGPMLALLGCQLFFAVYTLTFLLIGGNMVKTAGDKIHQILHRARHDSLIVPGSASEAQFQITLFHNSEPTIVSIYGITTVEMKILTAVVANVITYFLILVQLKIALELTRDPLSSDGYNGTKMHSF